MSEQVRSLRGKLTRRTVVEGNDVFTDVAPRTYDPTPDVAVLREEAAQVNKRRYRRPLVNLLRILGATLAVFVFGVLAGVVTNPNPADDDSQRTAPAGVEPGAGQAYNEALMVMDSAEGQWIAPAEGRWYAVPLIPGSRVESATVGDVTVVYRGAHVSLVRLVAHDEITPSVGVAYANRRPEREIIREPEFRPVGGHPAVWLEQMDEVFGAEPLVVRTTIIDLGDTWLIATVTGQSNAEDAIEALDGAVHRMVTG